MSVARHGRLAGNAAAAQPRRHHARDVLGPGRLAVLPVQAIVEALLHAGLGIAGGAPEGDDIVVDLAIGGNLHQLHGARAPAAFRLNPDAGALVVPGAVILVVGKVAVALHQAEAPGAVVLEAVDLHLGWIDQWPPQPLALAGPQRQAVAVMDFRAPVGGFLPFVFAVPVHAGQRRDAQPRRGRAEEQFAMHLHGHRAAVVAGAVEAVGAGDGRAIQQRIDLHHRCRLLQPELAEAGKFLRARTGGVQRDAARARAILVLLAVGAEIAGALEGQPVGGLVLCVQDTEAGKAQPAQRARIQSAAAIVEIVGTIEQLAGLAVFDRVNDDGFGGIAAEMEEGGGIFVLSAPQHVIGARPDLLHGVEVDALDDRFGMGRCRFERLAGAFFGEADQVGKAERPGRSQARAR